MLKKLFSSSTFALALAISAPAFAEGMNASVSSVSMPVSYADLDLSSAAGIEVLKARIAHTAEMVCGSRPSVRDIKSTLEFRSCVHEAMTSAVAGSGVPALAALYEPSTVALAD
jgi:UrcA family protein